MNTRTHWDEIYSETTDGELGWYEPDLAHSTSQLDRIHIGRDAKVLVVGAGKSRILDYLIARGCTIVVNDISQVAIDKLEEHYGGYENIVTYCGDISTDLPDDIQDIDLWFDRAVLHFLTEEARIIGYFANCDRAVKRNGHALFCEFSRDGAEQCAGLPVHRYDNSELTMRLENFEMVDCETYDFTNPFGSSRPYINCLYRKVA